MTQLAQGDEPNSRLAVAKSDQRLTTVPLSLKALGPYVDVKHMSNAALTAHELRRLYVDEGRSAYWIADQYETSAARIRRQLRAAGIELRPTGGQPDLGNPALTPEILRKLYIDEERSTTEIARLHSLRAAQVRKHLDKAGIPLRAKMPATGTPSLTKAVLRDLYVRRRWSAARIAKAHQLHHGQVSRLLKHHKITRQEPIPIDRDQLVALYIDECLTAVEIAERMGGSGTRILKLLRSYGIPIRPAGPRNAVADKRLLPTKKQLFDLYVKQRRSGVEISSMLGIERHRVMKMIHDYGIPVRHTPKSVVDVKAGKWGHVLTPKVLKDLYVKQGLSSSAIGKRFGIPAGTVIETLHRYRIAVRSRGYKTKEGRPVLTRKLLVRMYVNRRLSANAIGDELGYSDTQVCAALERFDIPRRQGGQRDWRGRVTLTKELLVDLYVNERMSVKAIAAQLHYSPDKVLWALQDLEIKRRETGQWRLRLVDRTEIDRDVLVDLYVNRGLTIEAVGEQLDVHPSIVRQRLHEHAIAVRPAGPSTAEEGTVMLTALYQDQGVCKTLKRFGIDQYQLPYVPPDRSTQKFEPPQLDPALLQALYVDLGRRVSKSSCSPAVTSSAFIPSFVRRVLRFAPALEDGERLNRPNCQSDDSL